MPHRTSGKQWLALYFENLLRLGSSTLDGALGSQILLAVVDRLIEIDVEIRWEDILKEDDSSKVFMFHVNLEDDNHHHGDSAKEADEGTYIVSDLAGPGSEAQHGLVVPHSIHRGDVPTLDEMADKMDMLMDMTFDHLQICMKQYHGNLVFDTLIRSFQTTILDTHKCKFTQFLIFYMCSLDPAMYGSSCIPCKLPCTCQLLATICGSRLCKKFAFMVPVIHKVGGGLEEPFHLKYQSICTWCVLFCMPGSDVCSLFQIKRVNGQFAKQENVTGFTLAGVGGASP